MTANNPHEIAAQFEAENKRLTAFNADLLAALKQAVVEIEEAAKVLSGNFPQLSSIYRTAAAMHEKTIAKAERQS